MVAYTGDVTADVAAVAAILSSPGLCGLDFETTIAKAHQRQVCTVQVTHEDGREAVAYVFPDGEAHLRRAFSDVRANLIAHNACFEVECLISAGIELPVECTMVAAKVLYGTMEGDKGGRTLWSLKALAERFLNKVRDKTIRDRDWRIPPDDEALEYCLDDTRDALALWKLFASAFKEDPLSFAGYRCIADALPAIAECNMRGLPFDDAAHADLIASLEAEEEASIMMLDLACNGEIENHGSARQVGRWMIDTLMPEGDFAPEQRVPWVFSLVFQRVTGVYWPTTKTGELSLDKGTLESRIAPLAQVNPDVASYLVQRLAWSKVAKLRQAFGRPLQGHLDPLDTQPYLRGSLRPHGAQTSRMSCVEPNLQQMPSEERFRRLFKAFKGRKLVIADYSQIELRVGCIIADDKAMQQVYASGEDIHQASATKIKRILTGDPEAVATKLERKASKAPTFASLYGAMAAAIALSTGMSIAEAERLLEAWLTAYPGIRRYRETAFEAAKAAGGVRLVSGQLIRMAADTRPAQAINAPVQGSSASVMYLAMTLTRRACVEARARGRDIWMAASIHDELLLDAADEDAEEAKVLLETSMRAALLHYYPQCIEIGMTDLADAAVGETWAEK